MRSLVRFQYVPQITLQEMHFVYVLYSGQHDAIYIGYSQNPQQRLLSHNHPDNKGWTSRHKPWELIHTEAFDLKSEALQREKELKSHQGRKFIRRTLLPNLGQ